jgi:hypothetical protein
VFALHLEVDEGRKEGKKRRAEERGRLAEWERVV